MSRSPKWIVALLGTLKAGASVVPLDTSVKEKTADVRAWIVDALAEGEKRDLPVIQMQAEAGEISGEKSRGVQNEAATPRLRGPGLERRRKGPCLDARSPRHPLSKARPRCLG